MVDLMQVVTSDGGSFTLKTSGNTPVTPGISVMVIYGTPWYTHIELMILNIG